MLCQWVSGALSGPLPRWVSLLVRESFGLYMVLRRRASLMARPPALFTPGAVVIPRRAARALAQTGLPGLGSAHPGTIQQRADPQIR